VGGTGTGAGFKPESRGLFRVLTNSRRHGPQGRCGRETCPARGYPWTPGRPRAAISDGLTECLQKFRQIARKSLIHNDRRPRNGQKYVQTVELRRPA
jgi:hypothetical protein